MVRYCSLVLLLAWPPTLRAQSFEEVLRSPQMVEMFDGKTLAGWEIEGEHSIKDGTLVIGGKAAAKLRPAVLGQMFAFYVEYQQLGPAQPQYQFRVERTAGNRTWSPHSGGDQAQVELLVLNEPGTLGRDHQLRSRYESRSPTGGHSSTAGGIFGGSGVVEQMEIVIPAGTQIAIRKLRWFSPPPPPPPSKAGLYMAMGVLGVILGGAMTLGWLLNRRRSKAHDS